MSKKEWARITICMNQEDRENLRILAASYAKSTSNYMRYVLFSHFVQNRGLLEALKKAKSSPASELQTGP